MNLKKLLKPLAKFLIEAAFHKDGENSAERIDREFEKLIVSTIEKEQRLGGILYRDR